MTGFCFFLCMGVMRFLTSCVGAVAGFRLYLVSRRIGLCGGVYRARSGRSVRGLGHGVLRKGFPAK